MTLTATELKKLPSPTIIEPVDFEAFLLERTLQLNALQPVLFDVNHQPMFRQASLIDQDGERYWRVEFADDAGLTYLSLESDPIVKQSEVAAYRELLLRQRINDALASNLLALARGSDLDHLGAFYGVSRLAGESDDAYRTRIQLSIRGWAPGTIEYYEFQVRSASSQIRDVLITAPDSADIDKKGWIYISVMSTEGDGTPSEDMLDAIRSQVNAKNIKLINDTLVIAGVEQIPVAVTATVWLLPDALPGTLNRLRNSIPVAFDAARGLGWSVTAAWFIAQLQQPGVKKSALNFQDDIAIAPDQCAVLTQLNIVDGGVAR